MFAGHFGIAAAAKAKIPEVPLWAFVLSTQLLDIAFVPLLLTGVESIESTGDGFGEVVIHADFSHAGLSALIFAVMAGVIAKRFWGKRGGVVVGSIVFSHWILDLMVHHRDIPLLPGNIGKLPLWGFGLWEFPFATVLLELLLIAAGSVLYFRTNLIGTKGKMRRLALLTSGVMTLLLILSLVTDLLGFE